MRQYAKVLETRLIERLCVFDMWFFGEGLLVVGPERIGIIVPILVGVLRRRVGRQYQMRILVVRIVAGLELAPDSRSGTAMLACMGGGVPQLHISQTHLYSWFTSTK